ncbi:DUF2971 domain-containing protein [Rhodococcus sp. JT-3]|uniref:DUF2971 domain-containing protein n=1 Tax=Rhodococcus sp. JT-3 TaxID=1973213 RepID=UPI001302EFB0|nr:DUF2971 domain-containing protein [Rhodococcus sp. JT-3]
MTTPLKTVALPKTLWHYTDAAGLIGILKNAAKSPTTPGAPAAKAPTGASGDTDTSVDEEASAAPGGPVDEQPANGTGTTSPPATVTAPDPREYHPVLWASAAQFLNDHRELVHGLEMVKKYIENVLTSKTSILNAAKVTNLAAKKKFLRKICTTIDEIIDKKYDFFLHCYTISFSEKPDMLSQWRAYGSGVGGFSIGFDPSRFPRSDNSAVHQAGLGLHKVQYKRSEFDGDLEWAAKLMVEQEVFSLKARSGRYQAHTTVQALAFIAASVKHVGFKEEEEWRFVEPGFFDLPEFRSNPAGLVPYRELHLDAEAVTGVWVGPGPNQYENYIAVKSLLSRFGYGSTLANVHRSETPFR